MLRFAPRYGMISPCLRRPAGRVPQAVNDNPASLRPTAMSPHTLPPRTLASLRGPTRHAAPRSEPIGLPAPTREDEKALLAAALRLFASHGHAAARQAARAARAAADNGDQALMHWWTAVCHTLDRNQAHALRRHLAERA